MTPLPTAHESMKAQPPPVRIPELGGVQPLPAFAADLAPDPVREASEAFAEALNRLGSESFDK